MYKHVQGFSQNKIEGRRGAVQTRAGLPPTLALIRTGHAQSLAVAGSYAHAHDTTTYATELACPVGLMTYIGNSHSNSLVPSPPQFPVYVQCIYLSSEKNP